jgi:hypothetical protein
MQSWRKATWALAIWNVAMILWAATAMDGVSAASCAGETGAARTVCEVGLSIGLTYGLGFVVAVWIVGVVALGLVWLGSRPRNVAH